MCIRDSLRTLVNVYNRQANEDKNEISFRTEQFINQRLEKINNELGNTEGPVSYTHLDVYKRQPSATLMLI